MVIQRVLRAKMVKTRMMRVEMINLRLSKVEKKNLRRLRLTCYHPNLTYYQRQMKTNLTIVLHHLVKRRHVLLAQKEYFSDCKQITLR